MLEINIYGIFMGSGIWEMYGKGKRKKVHLFACMFYSAKACKWTKITARWNSRFPRYIVIWNDYIRYIVGNSFNNKNKNSSKR